MSELADKVCVPCRGGRPPLTPEEAAALASHVRGWTVVNGHHIEKAFRFRDFAGALAFANAVGAIAEEQRHHPDIEIGWGLARVRIWTHKIGGLSENDFILAARIDRVAPEPRADETAGAGALA